MINKISITTIGLLICFMLPQVAHADHRVTIIQKKINKIYHRVISKKLKLENPQKKRVLSILKKYDARKSKTLDELMHLNENLKKMKNRKPKTSDFMLAETIQRINNARLQLSMIEKKKLSKLQGVLSQQQVADYLIQTNKMNDKIVKAVHKELKMKTSKK